MEVIHGGVGFEPQHVVKTTFNGQGSNRVCSAFSYDCHEGKGKGLPMWTKQIGYLELFHTGESNSVISVRDFFS